MLLGCLGIIGTSPPVCALLNESGVPHQCLMPPGVSPHDWAPSPLQLVEMDLAQEVYGVSSSLEPWASGKAIFLFPEGKNPHTWMSLENSKKAAQRLCQLRGLQTCPVVERVEELEGLCGRLSGKRVVQLFPILDYLAEECNFSVVSLSPSPGVLSPEVFSSEAGKCVLVPVFVPEEVKEKLRENHRVVEVDPTFARYRTFSQGLEEILRAALECSSNG